MSEPNETSEAVAALRPLGFSASEAEVYVYLVQHSPVTGYRVATELGKAVANTYKAIRSLSQKGAVEVEDGPSRLCRAVPPKELLGRLGREFEAQRARAGERLEHLGSAPDDPGVYRLETPAQVLERGQQMIEGAQEVLLMVAFPQPLATLAPALCDAAARGVDVVVKGYTPIELPGVDLRLSTEPAAVLEQWPGDELHLVVDAEQSLAALLARDHLIQGIWSASPYIGLLHHNGLATEFCMTDLIRAVRAAASRETLEHIIGQLRHPLATRGLRRLRAHQVPPR